MELKIVVQKIGGIWHGMIERDREIDERGLTAEIAERKAREVGVRRFGATDTLHSPARRAGR